MRKRAVIIGAGVAGLSAGCYMQMNGYETEIFELNSIPGGVCTSWKRKEFTFDTCIHWLLGTNSQNNIYHIMNELVDMQKIDFVYHEEYMQVEDKDKQNIRLFIDIKKLKQELLEKAPEDKDIIIEFTNAIQKFVSFNLPVDKASELYTFFDRLKLLVKIFPYLGEIGKWKKISISEYAEKCKNSLLKVAIGNLYTPQTAMLFIIIPYALMQSKSAGYPIGGSLNFSKLIAQQYEELGGKINYNTKVQKILTKNNSATGILLDNGKVHYADIVISAADGYDTIFNMLEGKYINNKIKYFYDHYKIFPSYIQVSLGISRTFEHDPHILVLYLKDYYDNVKIKSMMIHIHNYDPTLAPKGKTIITVKIETFDYTYWNDLRKNDMGKYREEKDRIADIVINILEKRFGNIKSYLEVIDVSTPATFIRYTNNWKGSMMGWLLTPQIKLGGMKKVLPGLKNFYMVGQWIEPGGGVPFVMKSGRHVVQLICKDDHKIFSSVKY